ncbi:MAG: hypothetical protein M3Z20_15685 [Chloroflexota bacterium]|nr:hypothetical protein [Chloroflexota bacterium]
MFLPPLAGGGVVAATRQHGEQSTTQAGQHATAGRGQREHAAKGPEGIGIHDAALSGDEDSGSVRTHSLWAWTSAGV